MTHCFKAQRTKNMINLSKHKRHVWEELKIFVTAAVSVQGNSCSQNFGENRKLQIETNSSRHAISWQHSRECELLMTPCTCRHLPEPSKSCIYINAKSFSPARFTCQPPAPKLGLRPRDPPTPPPYDCVTITVAAPKILN